VGEAIKEGVEGQGSSAWEEGVSRWLVITEKSTTIIRAVISRRRTVLRGTRLVGVWRSWDELRRVMGRMLRIVTVIRGITSREIWVYWAGLGTVVTSGIRGLARLRYIRKKSWV
tara:strand:+ start:137 stop:478 length:342 start_codon:yes stop_codon:yes gene_type:complete